MRFPHIRRLEPFGARSLVNHGLMSVTFTVAIIAGLFVEGTLGQTIFIALLNFTGGLWVAHSIHALGTVTTKEYRGVLNELFGRAEESTEGFNLGRFTRLLALIAAVTAVSLFVYAGALDPVQHAVVAVTVGTIALLTAMTSFLIAIEMASGSETT